MSANDKGITLTLSNKQLLNSELSVAKSLLTRHVNKKVKELFEDKLEEVVSLQVRAFLWEYIAKKNGYINKKIRERVNRVD